MISKDVSLWFAKDRYNNITLIDEANKEQKYFCPLCGSEVIPKAVNSDIISSHFAHIDKSKCSVESMIHWWYKNKFIQSGDKFKIHTDKDKIFTCKEILTEKLYNTNNGVYIPDITVITECGKTIYFEMNYTNKKKSQDYIDKWIELNNIVVEVDIKTLLNAKYGKDMYNFKALFYNGKCLNVSHKDKYYNTIGKLKEYSGGNKTDHSNLYNEIRFLDWFWRDIHLYKTNQIEMDNLYLSFVSIPSKYFSIVENILKQTRCTELIKSFEARIINDTYILAKNKIDELGLYSTVSVRCGNTYIDVIYNKEIVCIYCSSYASTCLEFKDIVLTHIINIKKQIDRKILLQSAITNEHLQNVIKSIDTYLKSIDINYNIYHRFGYEAYITLVYDYNQAVDFIVPDVYLVETCEEKIKEYITSQISGYLNSVIKINNIKEIENILNSLNVKYSSINCTESIVIWKSKWSYEKRLDKYYYGVNYRQLFANVIEIEFIKHLVDGNCTKLVSKYYFYNNDLYNCRYYSSETQMIRDGRLILKNANNINFLRLALISEFSDLVRKDKFKEQGGKTK